MGTRLDMLVHYLRMQKAGAAPLRWLDDALAEAHDLGYGEGIESMDETIDNARSDGYRAGYTAGLYHGRGKVKK